LYRGGCSVEGFQSKLVSKLALPEFVRQLWTGGRLSEVAITTRVELLPNFKFTGKMVKKVKFTGKIGKNGKNR
jgi:hypothetical protein